MSKECDDFEVLLTTEDLQKHKDNIRKLRELVSQKEQ